MQSSATPSASDAATGELRDLAARLVQKLKASGADDCDVLIAHSRDFSATVRLGEIESLEEAESRGLGMRVFKDGAVALAHTSDFGESSLDALVRDLMDMATVSDSDEANGLPDAEALGAADANPSIFDPGLGALSAQQKIDLALKAEAAGLGHDPRVTNSDGASFSDSDGRIVLANSRGFSGERRATMASLSVSLVGEEDGVKQTDYWYNVHRFLNRLNAPEEIGRKAAERTAARLGSRKIASAKVPVVVDPLVARGLIRRIFAGASASAIYRRASFLIDRLDQEIISPLLHISDDPLLEGGVASRTFDGEGVRSRSLPLVERGKLLAYAADSYSARRLGIQSTGHASRSYSSHPGVGATNLLLAPGEHSPQEIIGSVKNGLYLTSLFGHGFNAVTGDLSQGAAGFWIEEGKLSYPVQEITFAGNLLDLLKNVEMVGNDLAFNMGGTIAPTLLISEATLGGS